VTPSPEVGADEATALPRTIHGRYRALEEIGRGAMGRVYRVLDGTTGQTLALKSLHVPAGSGLRRQRAELWFRREFHVVAGLRHPCIVLVHDYGIDHGVPYYTMELLDGQDLRDIGEVGLEDGVRILRDVASALAFLHARRLVHRDVKPRNVRCTSVGRAKLIDFGILAAMGTLGDVAGTPTSLAPESLRGLPLDGRADLYSLGTLAYWMLTGRYPYIADSVDRLEQAWRAAPPPLRELRPALPVGLEELVMALVSIDADRRPGSAAEVIDRLDAITGTTPPPEVDVAQGWLRSAALVGRERELASLREILDHAVAGKGGAALIEAAAGQGKSRLLRETAWHAQLAGMLVLRARPDADTGEPYAVVRSIARQFAAVDPSEAERIGAAHESLLGRILPPGGGSSDSWPWAPNAGDPAEHRLRQQRELQAYLLDVARARPTAILVDDLHLCDEASAATLAALAHASGRHRLAIVAAVRTDAAPIARDAIATFGEASTRVKLAGLDAIGVRFLVDAVFGELSGGDRLATWLHQRAGGHATHTMELIRWLVDRGVVRYAEGIWVAGDLLAEADPPGMVEALAQRAAALSTDARAIAELIAIVGGRVPLEWCVPAGEGDREPAVFAAVDELVFAQVLVGDDRGLAFAHDGIRDTIGRGIDERRARDLHLEAARLLDEDGAERPDLEVRIGRHWLGAGEEDRAAALLERAGRRLYEAHSFHDAIGPLEAALQVLRSKPAMRLRCIDLQQMLMRAGVLCDRDVVLRHADVTLDALEEDCGLPLARKLAPVLGGRIGLACGLAWAWFRWLRNRRERERPIRALVRMLAVTNYAASVHSLGFARAEVHALLRRIAPLRAMHGLIPRGAYLLIENFLFISEGRWRALERNVREIDDIFRRDHTTPLAELDRRLATGAAHYMQGSGRALEQDPTYRESIAKLDEIGLQFFSVAAGVAHVVFHRLRGEETLVREHEARTDVGLVQLGNAWVFSAQLVWMTPMALGMTGDVLGLKRAVDDLERRAVDIPGLDPWLQLARGEYARARRDAPAAIAIFRALLARLSADELLLVGSTTAGLVDALFEDDQHGEAIAVARRWIDAVSAERSRSIAIRIDCARGRALAASGRGSEASAVLLRTLGEAESTGSPLLCGIVHEALALLARAQGDVDAERSHADQAALVFATTRNPVLIARGRPLGTREPGDGTRDRVASEATVQLFDDTMGTGESDHA